MPSRGDVPTGGGRRRSHQQGCHHGVPSLGTASAAVKQPADMARSKVRLGTLVQCRGGAVCSSMGTAKHTTGQRRAGELGPVGACAGCTQKRPEESTCSVCHLEMLPAVGATFLGAGEQQGFPQAPSSAVIMAGVPACCKHPLRTALGGDGGTQSWGGCCGTKKEW